MANFIKKYDSVSQYNSDSKKQYPNISYIEATGELKWMKALQFETVYTVDDASQPVTLFNDNGAFTGMEVDGNEVPLSSTYTFPATGEHVVKYSLNDNSAIGSGTFTDVTALTGVTFPPTVENIGLEAFKGCTGLTSITLPSGSMRTLGTSSFEDCTSLSSVTIEYSLYEIGQAAFKGCTSLTSINIPDSVGSIGEEAFKNSGLTGDVYLPSPVRRISDRCFEGCLNLSGIRYSGRYNYLTSIGSGAFKDCVNLTVCTYLNNDNLQEIGYNAFENTGLTHITIQPHYIYVRDEAFKGCTNLTRLEVNGTPNAFGQNVFKDCPSLTDIHVRFASPDKFTSLCGAVDAQVSGRTVKVPIGCVEAYSNSEHWQCFAGEIAEENRLYTYTSKSLIKKYIESESLLPIEQYSLGGNYDDYVNNKWVNLADWQYLYMLDNGEYNLQPETLLQLPRPEAPQDALWVTVTYDITDTDNSTRLAFRDNSFLAMKIDNELQSDVVREHTFTTTGTHTVEYALESGKFFPTYAFADFGEGGYGALNIPATSIVIPSGIEEIGGYAFAGLKHLASVTIGDKITSIGDGAFYYCKNLKSVTCLATTPPTLGSDAFNNTNDCPIYVPAESVETYKAANGWSTYASRIQAIPSV